MKFRKKPVVIEAMQWDGTEAGLFDIFQWSGGRVRSEHFKTTLLIPTFEGTMEAQPGDWIIRGVKGEMYPCKPDIFDATYERERTHHECAVARCEELERERDMTRLYCAEVASYVCDPIYDKVENRAGIAADAEAMATGEMVARYLDIKMQTERAIRAEAELERERMRLARYWGGMFWDSFNADKLDAAIDKEAAKSPGTEPLQSKLVED